MASEGDEQPYFDYTADDVISGTPPSPQFRPDVLDPQAGPHHATPFAANHPTITGPGTGPSAGPSAGPRPPPAYSYPTAISSARAGSRASLSSAPPPPLATGSYGALASVEPSPTAFQPALDWHSSSGNSLYSGSASPVVSGHSSIGFFDAPYGQSAPEPSFADFIAPSHMHNAPAGFDYASPWDSGTSAGGTAAHPAFAHAPGLSRSFPGTLPPALAADHSLSGSQDGDFSGAEADAASSATYSSFGGDERAGSKRSRRSSPPPPPRGPPAAAPRAQVQTLLNITSNITTGPGLPGSSVTTQKPASKLRSASRTSKNTVDRPSETAEEKRSRNSHNLVEKQYRNRLNAHFESLLDALPETARTSGSRADGADLQNFDFGEKRVSKAEVLDMARRHIRTLEQERDALERERDELRTNMEKLRETHADGADGHGKGPPDAMPDRGESPDDEATTK